MRWVAIFEEPEVMQSVRRHHEQAHFDYLRQHTDEILLAGGLRPEPGGVFVGGLWVLDVATRERAVELIEHDPYYLLSKRAYRLEVWGKALPDVTVVL